MNFNWQKLCEEAFKVIDAWKSSDIDEFVTIDDAFTISEFFEMFGDKDFSTSYKALDENGNIIGVLLYDTYDYLESNVNQFNIQLLIVNPSLTRKGNGTKMVEDIIEAHKDNYQVFRIQSEPDNIACQKVCAKAGFVKNKRKSYSTNFISYIFNTREIDTSKKRK